MKICTLAQGLEFPEGPVALADGSIVLVEIAAGMVTRLSPDGINTIVARPGGGPNGAEMGPDGSAMSATTAASNGMSTKPGESGLS